MDKYLHISDPRYLKKGSNYTKIPAAALDDAIAILGRRGRGKTNTATVLVEELHATGERFVVVDPVGVWWGLKSSSSGKEEGIPVIIMGGDHEDVPLEEGSGKIIADFVAEPTNPSVVLDLRGFRKGELHRFMTAFLEEIYHKNRHRLRVVFDECQLIAPQRIMKGSERMVGAVEDVCMLGRARGLMPILISPRPAVVNKNVLNTVGMLIVHQLVGPQERKALDEWVNNNAEDDKQRNAFKAAVPTLEKGVAWFWQPELGLFDSAMVRTRHTFDSSKTPKGGEVRHVPKVKADVDLAKLKQAIAATIEKAKAEDPALLRQEIAALKRELAAKPKEVPKPVETIKRVEVTALKPGEITLIDAAITKVLGRFDDQVSKLKELIGVFDNRAAELLKLRSTLKEIQQLPPWPPALPEGTLPKRMVVVQAARQVGKSEAIRQEQSASDALLTGPEARILNAVAWWEATGNMEPERSAVACAAQYSVKGGAFLNPLSALRSKGLVEYRGKHLALTDKGRLIAERPKMPTTTAALHLSVLEILSGPEKRILGALLDVGGVALDRAHLAERTNYSPDGGAFLNPLSHLKSMGLVEYPSSKTARARDILFLEK